jgi:nicotinate-nucleotide adenylyltransferase
MKKLGLLGGTFNPIHVGHLAVAQKALEICSLDKVIFIPCQVPPHKRISHLVGAADRLEMVRLAIQGNPSFGISDFEVNRPGKSYTIDTVKYFRDLTEKKTQLYFIVGGDNAQELRTWKNIEQLSRLVTFIVLNRPGHKRNIPKSIRHILITIPGIEVSASYIRFCLKNGESARYFLPDVVWEYIRKNKLYLQ